LISAPYGEQVNGSESVLACIEQAEQRLEKAMIEFRSSDVAFSKGHLIRSVGLLETIANELGFAQHQIALVDEQHEALKTAESSVPPELESAGNEARDLGILAKDRRTCRSTQQELESALQEITSLTAEHAVGGGDPFVRLRQSREVRLSLNAVTDGIRADWKAHEMCDSATTGARAALTFCNTYLREAQTDGIPDSRVLTRAIQRHGELSTELDHCNDQLTREHLEWPDLFSKINALTGDIAKVKSTLAEELAAAKDAADQVSKAADNISELHRWRSRHSVNLNRDAGRNELSRAKSQLAGGNYAEARQDAIASLGSSSYELQKAKSEESAKIQAAAAAASLAASRRRSSFSSSGSSFSSGSRSSSSSGFSRSSFSSRSGFSRSGW
jgi:DNA repair exonuclease SbcCD ATPase subunit